MTIKAVSFDVWNTLLRLDSIFNAMAKEIAILIDRPFENVYRDILDSYLKAKELRKRGELDEKNIVFQTQNLIANSVGIEVDIVRRGIARAFNSIDTSSIVFNDVLNTLEKIKQFNIKIGILGNTLFWPSAYTRLILEKSGVANYIDIQVYADEVGISKPDRRIFIYLCKMLKVEPKEVIHVGDGVVEDIGGAISAGMKAILIDRNRDSVSVLKDLGTAIIPSLNKVIELIDYFSKI